LASLSLFSDRGATITCASTDKLRLTDLNATLNATMS
jgi:hypothetical protein